MHQRELSGSPEDSSSGAHGSIRVAWERWGGFQQHIAGHIDLKGTSYFFSKRDIPLASLFTMATDFHVSSGLLPPFLRLLKCSRVQINLKMGVKNAIVPDFPGRGLVGSD